MRTRAVQSRHLCQVIDALSGKPRVELTGKAALSLNTRVKAALLDRLAQPEDPLDGWPAATALIELFSQFAVSPTLCLALIQDQALWTQLCNAKPNAFRREARQGLVPGSERAPLQDARQASFQLSPPIDRKALAAVIAVLLRLGESGLAGQLIEACPPGPDRRVTIRRLLEDEAHPLQHLKAPDVRRTIEATFDDMLKDGRDQYEHLRPVMAALRDRWLSERQAPRPLEAIATELAGQQFCMWVDSAHKVSLILGVQARPEPELLDRVLAYVAAALESDATTSLALDVVFNALGAFGPPCGDGRTAHLVTQREIEDFMNHSQALPHQQVVALTAFVRKACTLLFATGEAAGVETLIRVSLWLRDPLVRTDPGYQAAALQAVAKQGWAGLWLKTQDYNPWTVSTTLYPTLLECLRKVESPLAALRFIVDALQFLEDLGHSMGLAQDSAHTAVWIKSRDDLLDGLVHAVTALVQRSARGPSADGETLAQWVWVTGAAMELVRRGDGVNPGAPDLLYFSPCLAHFQGQGEPFAHTLKLLGCAVSRAQTAHLKLEHMRDLFKRCPIEIQSAVLHWPVPSLWTPGVLWRAIKAAEVLNADEIDPATQVVVLQDLLERRLLLPNGLASFLSRLLGQPGFGPLIALLQTRLEMDGQARGTLTAVCHAGPDASTWRPGLPALLRWVQVTAGQASADDTKLLFEFLALGVRLLHRTTGATDQDLLDIGAQVQLSTTPARARLQLDALIATLKAPQIAAWVLRGWILHGIKRLRDTAAPLSASDNRLLKTVLARYRQLLTELDNPVQQNGLLGEWNYFDKSRRGLKQARRAP